MKEEFRAPLGEGPSEDTGELSAKCTSHIEQCSSTKGMRFICSFKYVKARLESLFVRMFRSGFVLGGGELVTSRLRSLLANAMEQD